MQSNVFQSDKINRNESVLGLKHMNMQDTAPINIEEREI